MLYPRLDGERLTPELTRRPRIYHTTMKAVLPGGRVE